MRFVLVDRIIEQDARRVVAVKAVTTAEEYLADHFPGFAVLPGVMMIEAMTQAARCLAAAARPDIARPWVLSEVRGVRYGQLVRPGQLLEVDVSFRGQPPARAAEPTAEPETAQRPKLSFDGLGRVEGQTAVQGRLTLEPLPEPPPTGPGPGGHPATET